MKRGRDKWRDPRKASRATGRGGSGGTYEASGLGTLLLLLLFTADCCCDICMTAGQDEGSRVSAGSEHVHFAWLRLATRFGL